MVQKVQQDLCRQFGLAFPMLAMSPKRAVIAEVGSLGGMGILCVAGSQQDSIQADLSWLAARDPAVPFGVSLYPPAEASALQLWWDQLPDLVDKVIEAGARLLLIGRETPPEFVLHAAAQAGVLVGAVANDVQASTRLARLGTGFLLVTQTADSSLFNTLPAICEAVYPYRTMVVAAGGFSSGRQLAGVMALGAAGALTGNAWLDTEEGDTNDVPWSNPELAILREELGGGRPRAVPARMRVYEFMEDFGQAADRLDAVTRSAERLRDVRQPRLRSADQGSRVRASD